MLHTHALSLSLSLSLPSTMDDLPPPLILEILNRLNNSGDLARCRVVSKTLNALSIEVRSINLHCSFDRYTKSRSPETKSLITPFKSIFKNLVSSSRLVESVSLGVEKPLRGLSYDDIEDELNDLHLTDVDFVSNWLPSVAGRLRSISISDFWVQSCWRRSEVLSLISSCLLTSLTLEFIRLDDEDLSRVNDCFPSLQVLNLMGVGGLKEPKIHLLHLRTCQWTVSNAPLSLTILAPNLIKLKLKCVNPRSLVIDAPLLSDFYLSLEKASNLAVKEFRDLKTLQLESTYLCSLVSTFPSCKTIKNLTVESSKCADSAEATKFDLDSLLDVFPNTKSLTLGSGAWLGAETCFHAGGSEVSGGMKAVKEIIAHLFVNDIEITLSFIFSVLEKCSNLTDMALLIHREVESSITSNLITRCMAHCARVRWRWGLWKEGMNDAWVSDGI
ncbi:F-box/LRR-repeat protein At4g29420 isoform X2 [Camellia sinensis]|uniref:F-box/LRR-repeat protein At4g29420 isoform X2 n=1 Tax=Camellia sinensis TaxID=4442 RepID=UPI0010368C65|nr:F-box/LRR-repeat protein At4g29420 isoform X2 [Camellia sinensis]